MNGGVSTMHATEKDIPPIVVPEYQEALEKKKNGKYFEKLRQVLMKKKKKKVKPKKEKVLTQTPSLLPFLHIEEDYLVLKEGVMDILQISPKDLYAASEEELQLKAHFRSALFKSYYPSIKEVSMNFPTNTTKQKKYWLKKKEQTSDPFRLRFIDRKLFELDYLERERTNREFLLFVFAENEQQLKERRQQLIKGGQNSFPLLTLSNEKKIDILFLLNNQNTKL